MTQSPPTQPPPPPGGWGQLPGATPASWGPPQPAPPRKTKPVVPILVAVFAAAAAVVVVLMLTIDDDGANGDCGGCGDQAATTTGDQTNGGGNPENVPDLPGDGGTGRPPEEGSPTEGARLDEDAQGAVAAEPDANGNLPEDVVANFYEAASTADCELLRESMTAAGWMDALGAPSDEEGMEMCLADDSEPPDVTLESVEYVGILLEPDEDLQAQGMLPDTAIVEIVRSDGQPLSVWLVLEEGLWKVYRQIGI